MKFNRCDRPHTIFKTITCACIALGFLASTSTRAASFGTASNLNTARQVHTATLLSNGKVLVAGGTIDNSTGLNSVELYDPATNTWNAAANLNTARFRHTATVLLTGKVLVVGGQGSSGYLNSVELYDPALNSWSAAGSLAIARGYHTATLLPNGKVLVAAGYNGSALNSAELYDPVGNSWSTVLSLSTARLYHSASLLPSGKVLVAGGQNTGGTSLGTAEVYDPVGNTWTATGVMSAARSYHTATLLPNGNVLAAAGFAAGNYLGTADIYNPAGNVWSPAGSLGTARYLHTATLLPNGNVLVASGTGNAGLVTGTEMYNPTSNTWSGAGSLNFARQYHTATLLPNGLVLVSAGNGNGGALNSAELCDSTSSAWSATGSLTTPRTYFTITPLANGKALAAAGYNGSVLNSAELYDPASASWSAVGNLIAARRDHSATLLPNGKVLVVGGDTTNYAILSSAELFDPTSNTWSTAGNLSTARYHHTATLLPNGKVLVAAGFGVAGHLSSAELYDPASNTWSAAASLSTPRYLHSATLLRNGKVLVAGGQSSSAGEELYDPASDTWRPAGNLITPRQYHTATLLPSGKVLVAAGLDTSGYLNKAELYDPASNSWSTAGNLITARYYHTTSLLPTGKVLVAAGSGNSGFLSSAEVYDPVSSTWSAVASLGAIRFLQAQTLLTNGKVLLAGGYNETSGGLSSAQLYDPGLGFIAAWQPVLSTATSPLTLGNALTLTGTQFRGFQNESAAGGSTNDSASNIPVVQLQSLLNDQQLNLLSDPATPWSATTYSSRPFFAFPTGYASVRVFVNGVPSNATTILIKGIAPALTSTNNASFTYGTAGTFTVTTTGGPLPIIETSSTLPAGATLTDNQDGTATLASALNSPVGVYSIAISANNGTTPAATQTFMLTITTAPLTVTANAGTKVYGTANPVFTGTLTGTVAGDGITASYPSTATNATTVGTYDSTKPEAISPSLSDPNNKLGNYTLTTTKATLTITLAPLTVTANAASKVYGAVNPAFTGTLTGVVAGDGITTSYSSTATTTTNAGIYDSSKPEAITPILADPNSKLSNYVITPTDGTFTITQAVATIGLGNLIQIYDGSPKMPSISTMPSGLATAVTYNGNASAPSAAGFYAVGAIITDVNYTGSIQDSFFILGQTGIVSAATAAPNPVAALQPVAFVVAAANPNNLTLTYTWDFGDGSTDSGASVTHAYTSPGTYHVVVTIADGLALVTSSVAVTVSGSGTGGPALIGDGPDTDGDGFSDSFEAFAAKDPNSAASTPTGQPVTTANLTSLTILKAQIKLNFAKPVGNDSITLNGTLSIPQGFTATGAVLIFDAGGVLKKLTLGSKGSAKAGNDSFKVTLKAKKGVVQANPAAPFSAKFIKGSFASTLATVSQLTNGSFTNATRLVNFALVFDGFALKKQQSMLYTTKLNKSGTAK